MNDMFHSFAGFWENKIIVIIVRPEIMLPGFLFLIIFCVILLILLQKEKQVEEISNNNHSEEDTVYNKMYGDSGSRRISSARENDFFTETGIESAGFQPKPEDEAYISAVLVQRDGTTPGEKFFLDSPLVKIGRGPDNDLVVWDKTASEKHARIKRIDNRFVLFDEVSERGILLNGKKLLRPKVLCDFDEIRIGKTTFIFRGKNGV